jgi:phage-related protein (TIGR01555 family)
MWKSFDSFVNFLSGLGVPGRDKRTGASFQFVPLNDLELETLYRDSWIAGKIIDCPADDATREWRSWQARPNQIENIEALEKSFDVRRKMRDALILARLFGGSVIIMGVDGQGDPTQPLDVERVKKGSLKFLHVAAPKALGTGPIITDVMDPFYGYPEYFTRNIVGQARRPPPIPAGNVLPTSSLIRGETPGSSTNVSDMFVVHPSRVILLRGKGLPDPTIWSSGGPWGDSVLQRISESINDATAIFGTSAALVNEAKVDVIKIPGLSQHIAGEEYQKKLTARFTFANVMKSTINTIILDKDEDWTRITQDFGALPEMMRMFMLIVSGAADIPATRLLGQSPAGLSATGESDIRNYYDRIASDQENDLTPTINRLDEVLIRSALGDRDPSIYYEWNPLWQTSEAEKATIGVQKANAFKIDNDAGLIDPEALRIGRQNQLIEDGTYPGLEQALEDQQLLEMESMKTPEEQQAGSQANIQQAQQASSLPPTNVVPIKKAVGDYNPNHEPAGSEKGGEFSSAGGGSAALSSAPADRDSWPDHVKALKLPPAWTDVKINKDPAAALQATGKDSKGRTQYVYSAAHRETQAGLKFARIRELSQKFDKVLSQNSDNMKSNDSEIADHAEVTHVIMKTGIRPGSDTDTKAEVQAYGATTLQGRHVSVSGDKVRLRFTGKKGVKIDIPVTDPKAAAILKQRAESAGPKGRLFPNVTQQSLLEYSHSLNGGGFKTKDFRTLVGTQIAEAEVAKIKQPTSESAYKKAVKSVAAVVSQVLGNTPTVALQSYISPHVFAPWSHA